MRGQPDAGGGSHEDAGRAAYLAAFRAAHALIFEREHRTLKTHGGVQSEFAKLVKDVPGFLEAATENNPLLRAGDPEDDIGPVVVFLASQMSRFITGELINVDGGQNLPGYVSKPHNLAELGDVR